MDSAIYSKSGSSKMHVEVKIRAYDETTDLHRADELEKQCEAGPGGSISLFTDLLGDPLCRVRHYPAFAMLVAETQTEKEIVGLVRAGVKEVACVPQSAARVSLSSEGSACKSEQSTASDDVDSPTPPLAASPLFVSIAYILGLRVAPRCRRLGIGLELVKKMEEWCKDRGAEYVYIATEKDNEASVGLFTKKLGYVMFRNPAILLQPVYVRSKKLSKKVQVVELSKEEACKLYSNPSLFGRSEFLPKDIEAVVKSKLHRGTWLAFWKDDDGGGGGLRRFHSRRGLGLSHPGCFGSKSGTCELDCKDDGRNDRRMRRFHGVCDLDCEEDGGCDMPERMLHGVMDTNFSRTAGMKLGGACAHCKEEGGADCANDEGVHVSSCEHESSFNPAPTCSAHTSTNNIKASSVNPHLHASTAAVSSSSSWAMLSLWKCNEIYQLEMKGAPLRLRGAAATSRAVGHMLSWLVPIPTMPDVFKPFGLQLIYGMHAHGPRGGKLARHLCWFAHNLAKEAGCAVVAAEVAGCDPLRGVIPHWTCDEDMWCIKRLATSDCTSSDVDSSDWSKLPPPPSLFLDPRDF